VFDLGLWILGACFGNLLHLGERLAEGSIWDQTRHIHDLNLFDSVGLTASETQRYSRHLVLPEVGPEGQQKLKRSSVLVVGLGGLGVPSAAQS